MVSADPLAPSLGTLEPPEPGWGRRLALVSVPFFALLVAALSALDLRATYEPRWLLPLLNLTFATAVPLLIAALAARDFLAHPERSVLLLGCSMAILALAQGFAAGELFLGRPNAGITVHNSGAYLASLCCLASTLRVVRATDRPVLRPRATLAAAYASALGAVALVLALAHAGLFPEFFRPGSGPTELRQIVLTLAISCFGFSALLQAVIHGWRAPAFIGWYALGLALFSVGLAGVLVVGTVGSPVNWAGRVAQYLGLTYVLVGVLSLRARAGQATVPMHSQLREAQALYRGLFELSPDAILVLANDRVLFANAAAARLAGAAAPGELIGREALSLAPPELRPLAAELMRAETPPGPREFKLRRLDGRSVEVEVAAAAGLLEGRRAVQVVCRDTSERKRTEARFELLSRTAGKLLQSPQPDQVVHELCREVMAHLDCQVFFNFLLDAPSGRLRLNACAGISAGQARDLEWLEVGASVCGCVASTGERIVAHEIQRGGDPRTDLVRSLGIGAYCCHPLRSGASTLGTLSFGTRTRATFSPEDVALMATVADQVAVAMERMLSQRSLQEANARLVEADRRKNEFLAVLSHELRNPLTPIRNAASLLARAEPGGEQARRAEAIIDRQAGHLARLVDDLLDVNRVAQGKVRLQRERLELGELLARTVDDHRGLFAERGIELDFIPAPAPVFVSGDRTRLEQMAGNLLQNAAKFTHAGGRVVVAVAAEGDRVRVHVRDSGEGIAADLLPHLFQPFRQADRTLDRSRGGLGLGLSLVKGFAELHGGEVSAASEGPGTGAEFTLTLPLLAAGAPPAGAGAAPAPASAGPRRILLVEDNLDAAESLKDALELGGHEVHLAHTGTQGVERARALRPEIVLCDIGLPELDGYGVARALRADPALAGVFLVALTGYALPEDIARSAAAGFDRHLAKPPRLEELEELIAHAPRRPRAAA